MVDVARDAEVAGIGEPVARGQRPAERDALGGQWRFQSPLARQTGNVGVDHGYNGRSLGSAHLIGRAGRELAAAKGHDRRVLRFRRHGARRQHDDKQPDRQE